MGGLDSVDAHWAWLALGLVLAAAEMALPGVFLIWLAAAAIAIGLLTWVVPIAMPLQVVLFGVLAIVAVFTGRRYLREHPVEAADPDMNDRGARAVGETVVVTHAIADGEAGRVRLGDGEWLAKGPNAEPGCRMRVAAHDGAVLIVEHLH